MTNRAPTTNNVRIIPREADYLDRKTGARGEVFYDKEENTLRLYDGVVLGGVSLAKSDLTNISNAVFLAKANSAGFSGGVQSGIAGRIAYYPSTGSQVNDLAELYWHTHDGASMLHVTGELEVSGQKNRIRFHWDTLADLTSQVPAVDWHGMVAHAHDTGKLYYAHAGAWIPVASEAMVSALGVNYQFSVAADDSTQRVISTDEVIKFVGAGGITTASDAEGNITISGAAVTGSITFVGTTIDSANSSAITFTPAVVFDSDVVVGNEIVFADGSKQSTSAVGVPGPAGPVGPTGASGAGSGDVLSSGGSYVDNRIVRYDGATGTIIQVSSASISDAGLLTAVSFSGVGSLLTALNATELTSGTMPDARFPATLPAVSGTNLTALNATQLTSGTVPDGRFPATLPAASGVNLTALNATELTSGTVPVLRLGASGTRNATTFLRGDNTWTTVAGGGAASDSFATIAVAGQSSVVADSATDTLTIVAGTGISITTDAGTDTVTITSTVTAGATAFTGLTDRSDLTIDQFYLPAITRLTVTANGASAYRFDQYGTSDNPTLYVISGTTIAFDLSSLSSHPFQLRDNTLTPITAGLVHVTTAGVVTTGAGANNPAKTSGTLYWKIPAALGAVTYAYQCTSHGPMVGSITVKGIASI